MKCYDVKCASCGAIEEDCVLYDDEEPGKCPECGGNRERVYFGLPSNPDSFLIFRPIDLGDGNFLKSKAEVDNYLARAAGNDPAREAYLESDSKYDRKVRCDDRRHRAWELRKARGVCDAELCERAAAPNGVH
jgi:hypothetical protein